MPSSRRLPRPEPSARCADYRSDLTRWWLFVFDGEETCIGWHRWLPLDIEAVPVEVAELTSARRLRRTGSGELPLVPASLGAPACRYDPVAPELWRGLPMPGRKRPTSPVYASYAAPWVRAR